MTELRRSQGVEMAGEEIAPVNKEGELSEAIDGAVNDCILTVENMLRDFYAERSPSWQRVMEVHREARERIKKYLK